MICTTLLHSLHYARTQVIARTHQHRGREDPVHVGEGVVGLHESIGPTISEIATGTEEAEDFLHRLHPWGLGEDVASSE